MSGSLLDHLPLQASVEACISKRQLGWTARVRDLSPGENMTTPSNMLHMGVVGASNDGNSLTCPIGARTNDVGIDCRSLVP